MDKSAPVSSGPKIKILSSLKVFFRPYKSKIVLAVIVLLVAAASALALPVAIRHIVDQGFFVGQQAIINRYFLIILAIVIIMSIFSAARYYLVMWLGERIVADLRIKLYQHVLTMDPLFYETTPSGEVLSRLTTDTTLVQAVVGAGLSVTLRSSLLVLGSLFLLAITSIELTALILVIVPVMLLPIFYFGNRVRQLSKINQDSVAESSALAGETLNAIQLVQAYSLEAFSNERFTASVARTFDTARQRLKARALLSAFVIFIVFAAIMAVIWLGTQFVMSGRLTVGQLSQFLIYAIMVATNTASLSEIWGDMQRAAGALERLLQLLQKESGLSVARPSVEIPASRVAPIEFAQVTFHYPSRPHPPALQDFSLTLAPGETVALVGPSGAGKSTVLQLLLRFYDPQQGRISFGGIDIKQANIHQLRGLMGIVPQETIIFAADVMDNIRLGKLDATPEEIREAAKAAAADEFIQRLPEGYHTFLGERGIRLSGGQRQRIAIARAILKNPPLLLLDEATSALDAESEKLVQEAMEQLMENRTTLVIAHRLATVLKADRIVVMEQGRITAIGKHQELLRQSPTYARLAALQFSNEQRAGE